jgi:uncharacterized Fe-S cluster-containing radical SAM superfamily protein
VPAIDTDRFSRVLRERGIDRDDRTILITDLRGSKQEEDLSEPVNCDGVGRIRHFRRRTAAAWPENPLPVEPAARALRLGAVDTIEAQVFQNAVCNWRCWYCFVDFPLLAGDLRHSRMMTAADLVDLYLGEERRPAMIDLSGGQPDLVPEWIAWILEDVRRRGLEVYVWSDDNLSNDYYFTKLTREERAQIEGDARYGKVCCFKGFDESSFAFNTNAAPELFNRQFTLMRRLLDETPLDLYCYATFTTPDASRVPERMARFIDSLQAIDPRLPLRTIPLEVAVFNPVRDRLDESRRRALVVQQDAIASWSDELERRFSTAERSVAICDVGLRSG